MRNRQPLAANRRGARPAVMTKPTAAATTDTSGKVVSGPKYANSMPEFSRATEDRGPARNAPRNHIPLSTFCRPFGIRRGIPRAV
jgi:hypothetical protein